MVVGTVVEIWRYPVKSMGGGRLPECRVGANGIPGDRGWALRDEEAGEMRGAKHFPALLRCGARYLEEPDGTRVPPAEITLPDGSRVHTDDPAAAARLSALLGTRVTLWPLRPAEDVEHYRRRPPADPAQLAQELRAVFGRLPDEPLPDLATIPAEVFEFTSPRGTYFDLFPLHLLTTAWLRDLGRRNPRAHFDRRRFRPNFLIETGGDTPGRPELAWIGHEVRLGGVTARIEMSVPRCSMTMQPQDDLAKDPSVLRTIVRDSDQVLGVYASAVAPGSVRPGDRVEIV